MQKAQQADFTPFDAHEWRIALIVAQFNKHITKQLKESALQRATEYQISPDNIDIFTVAGAVEIPLVLQRLARTKRYNALLAIGCVINGATPHFDYVCTFVADGILRVQLEEDTPIGFGVLTCNDETQAQARAGLGHEHLDAVLQQAKILQDI
ncbi:MAG TPA: 6,7-dimethyl-8-ribityllumazine synthase [Patescibacteria group bacterium]|nr:6,7-dimethyl-8-ribityllumazine synthase [Patescibacteria group bacterium]